MDTSEEKIQTEIMEALLEYLDKRRTFRSALAVGVTAYYSLTETKEPIYQVASELAAIANQLGQGNTTQYPRETVEEIFTTMLEKLTKDY